LKEPVKRYNKEAGHPNYYFDVLITIQQQDSRRAFLHYIDVHGIQGDITDQTVIGSADKYASFFLLDFVIANLLSKVLQNWVFL
jgi:hypothetical protein